MSEADNVTLGFVVEVVQGDALEFEADVLAVKDSPDSGGLDAQVRRYLKKTGAVGRTGESLPVGESRLSSGKGVARARRILAVGTPHTSRLSYRQIRALAMRFLEALWEAGDEVKHLVTTAHGLNTLLALDEVEAFRSLLMGLADAVEAGRIPPTLQRVTIIEISSHRVTAFRAALRDFLAPSEPLPQLPAAPPPAPATAPSRDLDRDESPPAAPERKKRRGWRRSETRTPDEAARPDTLEEAGAAPPEEDLAFGAAPGVAAPADTGTARITGPESFSPAARQPVADESTPHVFVAMPFRDTYDDQFYLAILPNVRERALLCERMDLDAFTGEITDRMFRRIETARLVIALLDGANPNVFLEVGYAWGVRTPTVLIAHKEEPLPFDVRGHRVLIYDKIYRLKGMLQQELGQLLSEA